MNTRQKKKHDYFFNFMKGLAGYPRHQFVKKRKPTFTNGELRKLYKSGDYFIENDDCKYCEYRNCINCPIRDCEYCPNE